MGRNLAESVMGAVVLIVAAVFLYFFVSTAQVKSVEGYRLSATFTKVGGITPGSDVRVSGINVGTVSSVRLDPTSYFAVLTLSLRPDVKLPSDTVATIASAGLIGGTYVRLVPGKAEEMLADGGNIQKSQDFRSLEDQVGEIIFLATGGGNGGSAGFK